MVGYRGRAGLRHRPPAAGGAGPALPRRGAVPADLELRQDRLPGPGEREAPPHGAGRAGAGTDPDAAGQVPADDQPPGPPPSPGGRAPVERCLETARWPSRSSSATPSSPSPGRPSGRWRSTRSSIPCARAGSPPAPRPSASRRTSPPTSARRRCSPSPPPPAASTSACIALGVKPGDEVIITPMTWAATSNMVEALGGTTVFVEIDPDTLQIDPAGRRGGGHAADGGHDPRPLRRRALRRGPAAGDRPQALALDLRGRGPRRGDALQGEARRPVRQAGRLLLPSDQEHDHRRGRHADPHRSRPRQDPARAALPRPGEAGLEPLRRGGDAAGGDRAPRLQVQLHGPPGGARHPPARLGERVQRPADRAGGDLPRAVRRRSPRSAGRGSRPTTTSTPGTST